MQLGYAAQVFRKCAVASGPRLYRWWVSVDGGLRRPWRQLRRYRRLHDVRQVAASTKVVDVARYPTPSPCNTTLNL